MSEYTTFVGLDVHKDTIAIAVARAGGEVAAVGTIPYDAAQLVGRLRRLAEQGHLTCAYEAGPTGFGLQRALAAAGIACQVIAPALVPHAPGERIKTDRRDALKLARLARNGDLQPIRIPDPEHEYVRDLLRSRARAVRDLMRHRHELLKLLLRWDVRPPVDIHSHWTLAHERWLAQLRLPRPAQQHVFDDLRVVVDSARTRRDRLEQLLLASMAGSPYAPLVDALTALHGVAQLTAITLVLELAPFARFSDPHKCMAAAGLVPREHSSGARIRRGPITRTGSRFARQVLVEAAHHYRRLGRVYESKRVREVRTRLPAPIAAIASTAQQRLQRRANRLLAAGKAPQVVLVALARELAGAVWRLATAVERTNTAVPSPPER